MKTALIFLSSLFIFSPSFGAAAPKASKVAKGEEVGKEIEITVYKSPTCGCCHKWEEHLQKNGFKVKSEPTEKLREIKAKYKIPEKLQSCHTGVAGGYVIEGHVPADIVKRFLSEKPKDVVGITVPGMPIGSPGMESSDPENYEILTFTADGKSKVYDRRGPDHKN